MYTFLWKTKDGGLIPIWKMTDSHLINTINFIEEKTLDFPIIFHRMQEEAFKRGLLKVEAIKETDEETYTKDLYDDIDIYDDWDIESSKG